MSCFAVTRLGAASENLMAPGCHCFRCVGLVKFLHQALLSGTDTPRKPSQAKPTLVDNNGQVPAPIVQEIVYCPLTSRDNKQKRNLTIVHQRWWTITGT